MFFSSMLRLVSGTIVIVSPQGGAPLAPVFWKSADSGGASTAYSEFCATVMICALLRNATTGTNGCADNGGGARRQTG